MRALGLDDCEDGLQKWVRLSDAKVREFRPIPFFNLRGRYFPALETRACAWPRTVRLQVTEHTRKGNDSIFRCHVVENHRYLFCIKLGLRKHPCNLIFRLPISHSIWESSRKFHWGNFWMLVSVPVVHCQLSSLYINGGIGEDRDALKNG